MVLASRGFIPLRAFSEGIIGRHTAGAGRRRLTLPAASSSAAVLLHAEFTAPTNPSDRRRRPLPSTLPGQNGASFIYRSPACGLIWSGVGVPPTSRSFGISARRLMSEAARYFEGPWHEKYWLLEEYKKEHGNCLVPDPYAIGDVQLGAWVNRQRSLYKTGKLSANQREMLDFLGFSWDPLADKWERNFSLLEHFEEREGHIDVPKHHEEDGAKLGVWIKTQRARYKKGKLDESYQRRLENLGVSLDPHAEQWERCYVLAKQYKDQEGHCRVPIARYDGDVNLGIWARDQRKLYKNGKLSANRREKLDALGFSWDPHADQWERNCTLLEQFREREGHCNVPHSYEEDGVKLGTWVDTLRRLYKMGQLDKCYQRRLDNLGMSWDPFSEQWERNFALIKRFIEREGHCNVPRGHEEDGVKLGQWFDRQRQIRKGNRAGILSLERIERLDKAGMRW